MRNRKTRETRNDPNPRRVKGSSTMVVKRDPRGTAVCQAGGGGFGGIGRAATNPEWNRSEVPSAEINGMPGASECLGGGGGI